MLDLPWTCSIMISAIIILLLQLWCTVVLYQLLTVGNIVNYLNSVNLVNILNSHHFLIKSHYADPAVLGFICFWMKCQLPGQTSSLNGSKFQLAWTTISAGMERHIVAGLRQMGYLSSSLTTFI